MNPPLPVDMPAPLRRHPPGARTAAPAPMRDAASRSTEDPTTCPEGAPFGRIAIARGTGRGPTELAAFDAALRDAGVANYNLLCLSSVIPPGSRIERTRWISPAGHWGHRLYVVLSQARSSRPGEAVHAGIGWVQDEAGGQGLFVELHDTDRAALQRDLAATLAAMQRGRGLERGPVHTEIASATCESEPVCALVVAVYGVQSW